MTENQGWILIHTGMLIVVMQSLLMARTYSETKSNSALQTAWVAMAFVLMWIFRGMTQ